MVFHRGISRAPNSIVSTTSRIEGSGGKRNSFCAMYSFRMSFCIVPPSAARGMPRFSAAAMYIAQMIAAGLLIVIEVVTWSSGMPSSRTLHVGQGRDRHAALAELADGLRRVGVVAVQGRHVEGDREAGLALREQVLEARVGLLGACRSRRTCASSTACRDSRSAARRACRGTGRAGPGRVRSRGRRRRRACRAA